MTTSTQRDKSNASHDKIHSEAMLGCIADGIVFADSKNRIAYLNPAAESIFGIKRDDWIGRFFKQAHSPSSHRKALKMIKKMKGGLSKAVTHEINIQDKIVRATFSPVIHNGRYLGIIFVSRDITDTRRLQRELLQSEKLALMGKMFAQLAHEIRNPMVPIGGLARVIYRKLEDGSSLKGYAGIIIKEVDRLEQLLHNLLSYSKEIKPVFRKVSLNDTIEELTIFYKSSLEERGILLRTSLSERTILYMDAAYIKQAFINIIANAVHAMRDGGTLTIESSNIKKSKKSCAVISIKDTGSGMPDDVLQNIFEPFYTTETEGIGLGLSLTEKIVKLHGGTIDVKSREGKGTVFKITIPCQQ